MIDLRMVADDGWYTQLQVRRFCIQKGWTEWKSVPVVYDPSQLVDRVEVSEAKKSGAKPDGGLTREQVEKLLGELAEDRATHLANARRADANNERYFDHQQGIADGIEACLGRIRSELNPQPDEPSVEQDQDSESRLDGVCKLHPINNLEVVEASGKYYFLDGHEIQAWVLSQKVTFIADQSHAFDLIASVDQDEPDHPF